MDALQHSFQLQAVNRFPNDVCDQRNHQVSRANLTASVKVLRSVGTSLYGLRNNSHTRQVDPVVLSFPTCDCKSDISRRKSRKWTKQNAEASPTVDRP